MTSATIRGMKRGMKRMPKRVGSAKAVENAKAKGKYSAGETLYLKVWPGGRKTWVQRLTIRGKRTDMGLGPYPAVSLARAREKARENLSLVKSGGNPLAVKQEEARLAAIPTFEALARQHIDEKPSLLEEYQAQGSMALHSRDLCLSDSWFLEGERDHTQAGGRCAIPYLDHKAGDGTACPATCAFRNGPGRCPRVR